MSPELAESVKSETPEPADVEQRMAVNMSCQCRKSDENPEHLVRSIFFNMCGIVYMLTMRSLTCPAPTSGESAMRGEI